MSIEEETMTVAEFIYSNVYTLFEYFDNPLYQKIIQVAFDFTETEDTHGTLADFFINNHDQELAKFAIDVMASPYEFASWNKVGVYLNQKMPDQNFINDSTQAVLRFKQKKTTIVKDMIKKRISSEQDDGQKELLILAFMKVQDELKTVSEKLGNVIM